MHIPEDLRVTIAFVISLISFASTIITWVCHFISSRVNVDMVISAIHWEPTYQYFYIGLINNSNAPIIINEIDYVINSDLIRCSLIKDPQVWKSGEKVYSSIEFPIAIQSKCAYSGILYFDPHQNYNSVHETSLAQLQTCPKSLTFVLRPNKKRGLKKTLSLQNVADFLTEL